MSQIRNPYVAGMFYPAAAQILDHTVRAYLAQAPVFRKFSPVRAIIAPHAGYIYSGLTAAYAYRALENVRCKSAIVISPSHREFFAGSCIFEGDGYATPLGTMPMNNELADELCSGTVSVFRGMNGHSGEHAIEVHLPFLQTVLPDISFVPIVIGDQRSSFLKELADRMYAVIDDSILIIISSDLSHFYPRSKAKKLDDTAAQKIKSLDFTDLERSLASGDMEACGGGPISVLLRYLHRAGKKSVQILHRSDSGDSTHDYSEVVGYLSAAFGD